jgi:hypothetical protein
MIQELIFAKGDLLMLHRRTKNLMLAPPSRISPLNNDATFSSILHGAESKTDVHSKTVNVSLSRRAASINEARPLLGETLAKEEIQRDANR